jgi:hypothetical protein
VKRGTRGPEGCLPDGVVSSHVGGIELQIFESIKFLVPIVYLSKQSSGRQELIHVDCNIVPRSSPTGPTVPHSSPHLLLSPDAPDAEKGGLQ